MVNHSNPDRSKDLSLSIDALLGHNVNVKDLTRLLFTVNYKKSQATDPELAEMMRACAIPSRFDAKTIGALRNAPRAYKKNQSLLAALKTLSFVQLRGDGYYVYHDNTRDVVLEDWRTKRNRKQFRVYTQRLVTSYLHRGQQHYEHKNHVEALAEFNRALELESENGEVYRWAGMAHFELQDYNSALSNLHKAVELQPKESANYYWRATTLYHFNKFKEALRDFTKTIKLDAKDGHNFYSRGWTHYNMLDYKAALADFARAVKLEPETDYFHYGRGLTYYQLQNYKAALKDFSRAIKLNPRFAMHYNGRGLTYFQLNKFRSAHSDLSRAIKLQPAENINYHWRGSTRFMMGDYKAALADFKQSLKLGPEQSIDYHWRGLMQYHLKRYKTAFSDFSKAIELDSAVAANYYFRSLCSLHNGDLAEALTGLDRAYELDSEKKSHPFFWRGVVHRLQSSMAESEADLSQAVSFAKARKDECERHRILAKVALLSGEEITTRKHYRQGLKRHCQLAQLRIEVRYLDELVYLFPSRADIRKTREWFKSQLKKATVERRSS